MTGFELEIRMEMVDILMFSFKQTEVSLDHALMLFLGEILIISIHYMITDTELFLINPLNISKTTVSWFLSILMSHLLYLK